MSKLLVIVGVTGNQGRGVAETFLKDPTWKIRGTSRDPTKESSQDLAAKGIEIVYGDVDDVDSLKKAFKGANLIFGVTAFDNMRIMFPSEADLASLKPNQTIRELPFEVEVQQGKNIADAVATVGDSLELFVFSALSNVKKWSKGKYTGVYHFDSKATVVEYINEKYPEVAKKMSVLQMGFFFQNWKFGQVGMPWEKRPGGSMLLRIPGDGNMPVPIVHPSDAGVFVQALAKLPPGKNLIAYANLITWEEYVKLWSKVTGVPAAFEKATIADHDKIVPGGLGEEVGEMFAYAQEFGYWGGDDKSVTFTKDLGVEVRVTKAEDYIKNEDWSELLNRPVPNN
ncbi:NAD(P)-binding protein [Mollisia scopiformis]|uniref:NAD(P)-binding protein n=1 Tax=Mollisia scopiformis TaxID=149040 RepID=A0A194XGF5_MOLSC|nr:NAD(P)-binding protein [Mollisia scopiformis]KUJ18857.1 NAD(P)-binding protein [Mollisia scopiformis]